MISFYATIRYFWQVSLINLGPGAGRIREPSRRVDLGQYGSPLIWYGGLSISANIGHLTIIQFKNQFILLVHVISMVWCKFSSPCHLAPFTPKFEKSGPKPIKSPIFPHLPVFLWMRIGMLKENFEKVTSGEYFYRNRSPGNTNLLFIFRIWS